MRTKQELKLWARQAVMVIEDGFVEDFPPETASHLLGITRQMTEKLFGKSLNRHGKVPVKLFRMAVLCCPTPECDALIRAEYELKTSGEELHRHQLLADFCDLSEEKRQEIQRLWVELEVIPEDLFQEMLISDDEVMDLIRESRQATDLSDVVDGGKSC